MDIAAYLRHRLNARLHHAEIAPRAGLSALLVTVAACGGTTVLDGTSGAGGAGGNTGSSGSGGGESTASSTASSTMNASSSSGAASTGSGMPCDNKKGTNVVCLPSDSDLCPTGPDAEDAIKQTLSAECCQGASPDTCMVLQTLHCGPFSAGAVDPCCFDVTLANDGCATPGRPLVVDELHLKANMTEGSNGWHGPNHDEENVQRPQRHAERAEQWLADGLLEHASVASFTRAALALMQRGAPAALVDGCLLAARQEIGHARDAFSLASAYGGRPVSPGPLPLPPSVSLPDSLTAFALETFAEGCVNETCAAVLAAERLLTETDALAQRALGKVVKEETEHAELSWRMLAWLLEQGGGETEEALRAAAVRLQTEAHQDHTTIDQVVVPCLERLLDRGRSTARRHPGRGDSPGLCSP